MAKPSTTALLYNPLASGWWLIGRSVYLASVNGDIFYLDRGNWPRDIQNWNKVTRFHLHKLIKRIFDAEQIKVRAERGQH
jgi:hypothetical protein